MAAEARDLRIETFVMADDHHAVGRHTQVELERRDTDGERATKDLERVLWKQTARPAMTLQIELCKGGRAASNGERNNHDEHAQPHAISYHSGYRARYLVRS